MNTPLGSFLSRFFDDELVEALVFLYIYFFCYLAILYIVDHTKAFHGKIYEFPIDPAREPLPKKEVVNE